MQRRPGLTSLLFLTSFLSLALLRIDAVAAKPLAGLVGSGLIYGFLMDAVTVMLMFVVYLVAATIRPRVGAWVYGPLLFAIFTLTLADDLYFKFFGSPLRLWVIKNHLFDIGTVSGSAATLGFHPAIILSLFALVASFYLLVRLTRGAAKIVSIKKLFVALPIFLLAFVIHQLQFNVGLQRSIPTIYPPKEYKTPGNLAANSVFFSLLRELDPKNRDNFATLLEGGVPQAKALLAEYRTRRGPDLETTGQAREALGLDPTRRPNVIVMFVESLRGYEFLHPTLGEATFPETHRILREHGVLFSRAYSSSLTAGQTVRGIYSSLCSALPNMLGPAPLLAYPEQDIDCIQKPLSQSGYQTFWMVPHSRKFHNMEFFETRQGTQSITDIETFGKIAGADQFELGIADDAFYRGVITELERQVDPARPFFLHAINVGTHHPWGKLPASAPAHLQARGEDGYELYLARLRYWDYSFGRMYKLIESKPWMKNTVVILVSDHSMREAPPPGLNAAQNEEKNYRVVLGVISPGTKPRTVTRPVMQMDIAPTIAALAGVKPAPHYLGRDLMQNYPAAEWLFIDDKQQVNYRTQGHSCFSIGDQRSCYRNDDTLDLLYSQRLEPRPEVPAEESFFKKVSAAEHTLHGFNDWRTAK